MSVLIRAASGFMIALFMLYPQDSARLLNTMLVDPIHERCAEGLPVCGHDAGDRLMARIGSAASADGISRN